MNNDKKGVQIRCGGIGCLGSIAAAVLSWIVNKSVLWCIIHFFCSWFYVIYWALCRSKLYDWLCSIAR
jgi:hypothetical protein